VYIITFYSFKGGVGRTFALVNVAAELARRGRRVLLVDFDLEAPGLETFERLRPSEPHLGVVEYVKDYMRTMQPPDVRNYVYSAGSVGKKNGQMWVMSAGRRDRDYQAALVNINWKKLYSEFKGFELFENAKKQWEEAFKPDYVLIDSRTGHTDVEGICTRQLPEAVVVLFFPNEQNLVGLKDVCRRIRGERERGLKKNIRLHFAMSNVPDLDDEDRVLRRRLEAFHKELGIGKLAAVIHRYESVLLFNQAVFVLDKPRSRLAKEYRRLVQAVILENPEDRQGAVFFLNEVQKENSRLIDWSHYDSMRLYDLRSSHREDSESAQASRLREISEPIRSRVNEITDQFWNDPEVLFRVAQYLQRHGEWELALGRYDRVLKLQPDCGEAMYRRAFCRRQLRDHSGAAEDFLHYLRVHGPFTPNDSCYVEEDRQRAERNERSLLELLSISLDTFRKGLDLPAVPLRSAHSSHSVWFWLRTASESLLRQRRWQDAIQYLESTVKDLLESRTDQVRDSVPTPPGKKVWVVQVVGLDIPPAFYLAMAYWGKTGQLRQELCSQAFTQILSFMAQHPDFDDFDLHQLRALVLWGLGLTEEAAAAVNQALANLEQWVDEGGINPGISYWTFQKTTPREYRADCEELQRMIGGDSIRPAFLREAAALGEAGSNER
jgi:MinD-like ATPase involved in chromosome partitioning or flagellar assembly